MATTKAVTKTSFAERLSSSPFLLATRAETAILIEKNIARPINLGCVVKPTAEIA